MFETGLWILLAAAALAAGADCLVRGASGLASGRSARPALIGMLIVAFGNSSPELFVTTGAAQEGLGDLAVGNANIFNIGMILGIAAMLCPMQVAPHWLRSDTPLMLAIMGTVPFILANGRVGRWEGLALVAAAVLYLLLNSLAALKAHENPGNQPSPAPPCPGILSILLILVGIFLLIAGSRLLLTHAMAAGESWGVSEATLGLTLVAAITSLPELLTSIVAARRGEPDILIGNIIGSNIFNVLGVLGTAALWAPFRGCGLCHSDVFLMLGFSALLVPMLWTGRKLSRLEGAFLIAAYMGYWAFRYSIG
ncbi:MAG: calcium/sodium antiporter [Terrimicrobiaceae bacterium]